MPTSFKHFIKACRNKGTDPQVVITQAVSEVASGEAIFELDRQEKGTNATGLMNCVLSQNHDGLLTLLEAGANPNIPAINLTPLMIAISHKHLDDIALLLQYGADPNLAPTEHASLPIIAAVQEEDTEIVDLLIGAATPVPKGSGGEEDSDTTRQILTDLNAKCNGHTALTLAAENGSIDMISKLIAGGANPNIPNDDKQTPLLIAVKKGNPAAVEMLVEAPRTARALEAQKVDGDPDKFLLVTPDAIGVAKAAAKFMHSKHAEDDATRNMETIVKILSRAKTVSHDSDGKVSEDDTDSLADDNALSPTNKQFSRDYHQIQDSPVKKAHKATQGATSGGAWTLLEGDALTTDGTSNISGGAGAGTRRSLFDDDSTMLAVEAAEKEATDKEVAEAERAAKEAADKAEAERLAKETAEKEAANKAEAERAAKEAADKAEAERLAVEAVEKEAADKAEAERLAKEAAEELAKERSHEAQENAAMILEEEATRKENIARVIEEERLAKEAAEQEAADKAETERLAAHAAREAAREAKEKADAKAEAERLTKEAAEKESLLAKTTEGAAGEGGAAVDNRSFESTSASSANGGSGVSDEGGDSDADKPTDTTLAEPAVSDAAKELMAPPPNQSWSWGTKIFIACVIVPVVCAVIAKQFIPKKYIPSFMNWGGNAGHDASGSVAQVSSSDGTAIKDAVSTADASSLGGAGGAAGGACTTPVDLAGVAAKAATDLDVD